MSFLLLRAPTPPCICLLLPHASFYAPTLGSRAAAAAAHLPLSSPATFLRALKSRLPACPRPSRSSHGTSISVSAAGPYSIAQGLRSRFYNTLGLQRVRRYGTFDRRNWFDSQKRQVAKPMQEAHGMRLLDRLKSRGQLSDIQAPPYMTNVYRPSGGGGL